MADDGPRRSTIIHRTLGPMRTIWGERVAPALMTPLGIVLTIPILVAGVGFLIWWQGRTAVDASVDAIASRQFGDRAEQGAQHARDLLGHAAPLSDAIVAYVEREGITPEKEGFALRFRDLLRASPGVAYTSVGTRDGSFFGVYRDAEGRFVLTDRIYEGPDRTHTRDYYIGNDDSLSLFSDNPEHDYDPRVRPWYITTVENQRRTWSDPYVWFDIGVVGITCSQPILDDDGNALAVTTVDFHLNGLSEFVESLASDQGDRTFVFSDAMEVIAFPGARQEFGQGRAKGKKLMVADVQDAAVAALFQAMPAADRGGSSQQFPFEVDGEPYLAAVRPIDVGQDVRWFVATFGPTGPLTAPAAPYERTALIVSAVALLAAILIAAFFARFIVRTHLRIERAEIRAQEADDRARRMGSYRMTRKLGQGGMGEVWIAEHDMLARPAAVKLIRGAFLDSMTGADQQVAIERFRREARMIAGLRSRHTIQVYDFGVADDGALFYVMELLDGLDLDELIDRHGPVPPRRAVDILLQAAASLQEAHESGVVHRDIKPANIFLCREADERDVVKVLDFGMARQLDTSDPSLTTEGEISGTPAFMAPEQVRGEDDVDGRADVYALGCVAYWLLAGRPVFVRDSAMAAAMAQVLDEPEALSEVVEKPVPGPLEAFVSRCLTKDPDERTPDMATFAAELEALRDDLPDDGWSAEARDAWWEDVPELVVESLPEPTTEVQLSPKRSA